MMLMTSCYKHAWKCGILVNSTRNRVSLRSWSATQVFQKATTASKTAAVAGNVVASDVPRVASQLPGVATDLPGIAADATKKSGICETPPEKEEAPAEASPTSRVQAYMMLSKFRLTSLVVMTSMSGYAMAPAVFDLPTVAMCAVGTGLLSAAANSVNQFFEVPFDSQMARTRNRLLVRSVVTPLHAFSFAVTCATTGSALLYFGVNPLTASLGFANLFLYTCVYTPLKRISILNTWVGSIVGALPPLMGWAGCTGALEPGAWVLAGILYAWQFPHFNALSWNLRPDYSRAGYRMMSVTDPALCRRTTLRYTGLILGLCCCAPFVDLTNMWFALESLPLNGYFLYLAWKFYKESDSANSRKLFRFSLVQLPALMLLMLINKKKPSEEATGTPLPDVATA